VIFLSLSSETSALRGGYGQERYEKEEMQRNVYEVFTHLQQDPRDVEDWNVIDASGDIEEVSDQIWNVVEPILEDTNKGEIKSIL
jgi:dTMP kinase